MPRSTAVRTMRIPSFGIARAADVVSAETDRRHFLAGLAEIAIDHAVRFSLRAGSQTHAHQRAQSLSAVHFVLANFPASAELARTDND